MTTLTIDFSGSQRLELSMSKIPDASEQLVNKTLKKDGTKKMIAGITDLMPVSNKKKIHAKFSNPLTYTMINLGFVIRAKGGAANSKGSFGYLVFPDQGIGPHNPISQEFFEKGAKKETDSILDDVIAALEKAHDELNI